MPKEECIPLLKNLKFKVSKGLIMAENFLLLSFISEIKMFLFGSKLNILHIGKIENIIDIIFSLKLGLFINFIYENFFFIFISNRFLP